MVCVLGQTPVWMLHFWEWSVPFCVQGTWNLLPLNPCCFFSSGWVSFGFSLGLLGPFCAAPYFLNFPNVWSDFWMFQFPSFNIGMTFLCKGLGFTVMNWFWASLVLSAWLTWSRGIVPTRIPSIPEVPPLCLPFTVETGAQCLRNLLNVLVLHFGISWNTVPFNLFCVRGSYFL